MKKTHLVKFIGVWLLVLAGAGCTPTATIQSPADNATFAQGAAILFAGAAADPLEGELSGEALVWTSSIDGEIGTGSEFTRNDLSAGGHAVVLTATNAQGHSGTAVTNITVQPAEDEEEEEEEQEEEPETDLPFTLTSSAFSEGEIIPAAYTCEGDDLSPDLLWPNAPSGAASFALIMDDPDAPGGTFTHWVVFDIPGTLPGIAEGFPEKMQIADIKEGRNDFSTTGYRGPCPPLGDGFHRYFLKVFALDVAALGVAEGASRAAVESALQGHVLDEASLMGKYQR